MYCSWAVASLSLQCHVEQHTTAQSQVTSEVSFAGLVQHDAACTYSPEGQANTIQQIHKKLGK